MLENELIIPELTKEELKEIARSQNVTSQIWTTNKDELNSILMSKKLTSSWGDNRKLPHAFTEQGIYMLTTVLKGDFDIIV